MKTSISSFMKVLKHPRMSWFGRVAYYYLILVALAIVYFVQQQHTPAPFIYNNF